ncbi:MAG: IS3 family transposase [Rhodobacteraceae bacterium]|nr:IS3 family transposase [Paracoccaceae bacterium]
MHQITVRGYPVKEVSQRLGVSTHSLYSWVKKYSTSYKTREDARRDVFDYIEMFYNPKRKHARNEMLSPVEFERQQKMKQEGV